MSVPADLLAALQANQGAPELPPGLADQGGYQPGQDPLQVLQECIQSIPGVLAALPDPRDVQDATRALLLLTGIQTRLMQAGTGGNGPQPGR